MESSGLDGAAAAMGGVPAGPLRSEWRPLLLASIASVAAHALLLAGMHVPPREEEVPVARFAVRLAAAPVTPRAAEPSPPAQAAPPEPARPQVAAAAPLPARSASAPVPERKPAPQRQVFHTEETWSVAPRARSAPRTGDTGADLKARRLEVTVWIDAAGRVQRATVKRNEVSEETAQALEQAVMGVRFLPARLDGQRVGAEYRALLCFDDEGRLDTAPRECWQAEGTTPQ